MTLFFNQDIQISINFFTTINKMNEFHNLSSKILFANQKNKSIHKKISISHSAAIY